jgi:glutathione S-transferase
MEASTMVVHGGWNAMGIADFSPFSLKVKTYLRMVGIPYVARLGDPRKGPTKKIPFIEDGATRIGDSGLIFDYLKKKHGDSLDAKLTPEQHALGHVIRRTLEESTYWAMIYTRWLEDEAWPDIAKAFAPLLPPVIGSLLLNGPIRGGVRKAAFGQGIGRHAPEQVYAIGCADTDAIATMLGEKAYLFGDTPSSYDAILYGFIANVIAFPQGSPICKRARGHANLVAFVDRVKAKYWATPDVTDKEKVGAAAAAAPP